MKHSIHHMFDDLQNTKIFQLISFPHTHFQFPKKLNCLGPKLFIHSSLLQPLLVNLVLNISRLISRQLSVFVCNLHILYITYPYILHIFANFFPINVISLHISLFVFLNNGRRSGCSLQNSAAFVVFTQGGLKQNEIVFFAGFTLLHSAGDLVNPYGVIL